MVSEFSERPLITVTVTVPTPYNVSVVSHNAQMVGQPLLLECIVITVRGITSTVDIVWSSDDVVVHTVTDVSINFTTSLFASYTSTYIILQLSTLDDGRVYSCEVVVNTSQPVTATGGIELDVIGNNYHLFIIKFKLVCS